MQNQPPMIPNPGDIIYPKCPHCGEQPARCISSPFEMGAFLALAIFCGNPLCAKLLNVQALSPLEEQKKSLIEVPLASNRRM